MNETAIKSSKLKMKTWAITMLIFNFSFLIAVPVLASMAQLKEGNRQFKNGHYEESLRLYQDALIDTPYSSVLHYNAGAAAYQMGDFLSAEKAFTEAAQTPDPILKGLTHYNRGNALFRQGRWADAVNAYKESLRANPRDEDAKYNLGVAMRAEKNPPKAQPNPQKGPPKKDNQGQGKGNNQSGEKKDDGTQSQAQAKPGQMSKEDAERLLAAAGSGEKKKSNQKNARSDAPRPDEDW